MITDLQIELMKETGRALLGGGRGREKQERRGPLGLLTTTEVASSFSRGHCLPLE